MTAPELIRVFVEEYSADLKRRLSQESTLRLRDERRLNEARAELDRIVTAVQKGIMPASTFGRRAFDLESEIARIEGELNIPAPELKAIALDPAAIEMQIRALDRVEDDSQKKAQSDAGREIRKLIDQITIMPAAIGEPPDLELSGRLAPILGTTHILAQRITGGAVVARERFSRFPSSSEPKFLLIVKALRRPIRPRRVKCNKN